MKDKEKFLVSIIVPVYNTESYLCFCVDSLLGQTYSLLEVILVNDGSTDGCPGICDTYANTDPRVKVIHKSNQGSSDARNKGLEAARGKYILFVDSDDFWRDAQVLEQLVETIEKVDPEVDFVSFNCNYFYQKQNQVKPWRSYPAPLLEMKSKKDKIIGLIESGIFPMSACMKLIKRDFLIKQNIRFVHGITSEDIPWFLELLMKSRNFILVNGYYYMYRKQVAGTISSSFSEKKYNDLFSVVKKETENIQYAVKDEALKNALLSFMAYEYCILMAQVNHLPSRLRSQYLRKLQAYKWLLQYDIHPKVRKVKLLLHLVGGSLTRWILLGYVTKIVNRS